MKNKGPFFVDYLAEEKRAAERKAKREEKRKSLPWANRVKIVRAKKISYLGSVEVVKKKRKPKRISARRQALNRLRDNCRDYVLLRAKRRLGHCEVGLACGGFGQIEVWYHIFPQSTGNRLKYDERNILGSCHWCNAQEWHVRQGIDSRFTYKDFEDRHRKILGSQTYEELKATQGRRQIPTHEANLCADLYQTMIKSQIW